MEATVASIERAGLRQALGLKRSEAAALAAVAVLGAAPGLALWALSGRFQLAPDRIGAPPFVVFALAIAGVLCLIRPLVLVARRHPAPLRQLAQDVVAHRSWLVMAAAMVVLVPETLEAASQVKKLIPQVRPFYADAMIADAERVVLGGVDAWRLTHAVLGNAATRAIDLVYGLWHLVNISALTWIVLTRNRAFQLQAALSYQLAWLVMGGGMATLFASVGPCFYEVFTGDPRFAPLLDSLRAVNGPKGLHSLIAMDYLLQSRGTNAFGGGISAMPSLHVGIAVFMVLAARFLWPRWRVPQVLALIYAVVILVGSVHLGWHYAADGVLAALGMMLIWNGVAAFRGWLERRLDPVVSG